MKPRRQRAGLAGSRGWWSWRQEMSILCPCDERAGTRGLTDIRYNRIVSAITEGGFMTEPSYEELKSRVAELEKQGGGRRSGALEFRVGEKGGVSVYGLGRFPVTLYYEQWTRLLDAGEKLREFLEENKAKLKLKDQ